MTTPPRRSLRLRSELIRDLAAIEAEGAAADPPSHRAADVFLQLLTCRAVRGLGWR